MSRTDKGFHHALTGYSLTTAEILYRIPDHQSILQTFIWQDYDLHPRFPRLFKFLDYWAYNLDGPLHTVRVAHAQLLTPWEIRLLKSSSVIN
jgi:uncharacterized protein Usg